MTTSPSSFEADTGISSPGLKPGAGINGNRLIGNLPHSEIEVLERILEFVPLSTKQLLTEAGGKVEHIYFPEDCVISLVTVLADGSGVEALTVGRDGATGLGAIDGIPTTYCRIIAQISGSARRTSVSNFLEALPGLPELHRRLRRYMLLSFEIAGQSAACNRAHTVEERCARWLLLSSDRVGREVFDLTQGFLSQMLGVRRPGVTVAIGVLKRAGLIEHERGIIRILDRERLEQASCECYRLGKARERELFLAQIR